MNEIHVIPKRHEENFQFHSQKSQISNASLYLVGGSVRTIEYFLIVTGQANQNSLM